MPGVCKSGDHGDGRLNGDGSVKSVMVETTEAQLMEQQG